MPERRDVAPTTAERLGRMLVVVPYLVRHPGTSVDRGGGAVRRAAPTSCGATSRLLMMSGVPPYGPGDLIDVDIDEGDEIWITMADHFARPLRLTRQEATAVRVRAAELMATPGVPEAPDLASAVAKLDASLGEVPIEAVGRQRARRPCWTRSARRPMPANAYGSPTWRRPPGSAPSGRSTRRRCSPSSATGTSWRGTCGADDERLLRIDRIESASRTGDRFEPRGLQGAGRPLYRAGEDDVVVRLALGPESRWVAEYYATTSVTERRRTAASRWSSPTRDLGWVAALLLRLGPDAEVLEPAELGERRREMARRTLARYEGPGAEPAP